VIREVADAVPQPFLRWVSLHMNAMVSTLHGELEEAEALIDAAMADGSDSGQPDALMIFAARLVGVRHEQGRVDEVVELVEQGVEGYPDVPAWSAFLTRALSELGRREDARALLSAADFAALPHDFVRLAGLAHHADACAQLGATERADEL
jgi:hypothetical protein